MLLCPVRTCHEPLGEEGRRAFCPRGHSFDFARSGYLNLLQPQDRRSNEPGDTADAVAARRRILDRGIGTSITRAVVEAMPLGAGDAMLDAGCGEGHVLAAFRARYGVEAWGTDISVPAIEMAAKRHRDCRWVVANADRFLPFAAGAFRAVASVTARMNPAEFHRLLAPGGTLLVVIPAADDLLELREAVQGRRDLRDRVERTVAAFAPRFALLSHATAREVAPLDAAAVSDIMTSTYRGLRTRERERLARLGPMDVTLSRELLRFAPLP